MMVLEQKEHDEQFHPLSERKKGGDEKSEREGSARARPVGYSNRHLKKFKILK